MGVAVAKRLEEAGAICIGFKEIDCFLHDAKGFSLTVKPKKVSTALFIKTTPFSGSAWIQETKRILQRLQSKPY